MTITTLISSPPNGALPSFPRDAGDASNPLGFVSVLDDLGPHSSADATAVPGTGPKAAEPKPVSVVDIATVSLQGAAAVDSQPSNMARSARTTVAAGGFLADDDPLAPGTVDLLTLAERAAARDGEATRGGVDEKHAKNGASHEEKDTQIRSVPAIAAADGGAPIVLPVGPLPGAASISASPDGASKDEPSPAASTPVAIGSLPDRSVTPLAASASPLQAGHGKDGAAVDETLPQGLKTAAASIDEISAFPVLAVVATSPTAGTAAPNPSAVVTVEAAASSLIGQIAASLEPAVATAAPAPSIDAEILPGTVQLSSHLGFFREAGVGSNVPVTAADPIRVHGPGGSRAAAVPPQQDTSTTPLRSDLPGDGKTGGDGQAPGSDGPVVTDASVLPRSSVIAPTTFDPAQASGATSALFVAPLPQEAEPLTQTADAILALANTVVPDADQLGTHVAPARTMTLQLSPTGLGTLTLRLHASGRVLDVQIEASNGATAAMIDHDRDALSDALRAKGVELQALVVRTSDPTVPGVTHAQTGSDAGSADRSSNQSSGGSPFGQSSGRREARDRSGQDASLSRSSGEAVAVERGGSSLFV